MSWRIAESLKKLREQINAEWSKRDKRSDGGIGDERHANSSSDHNPWVKDAKGHPVVTAIDIDEDLSPSISSIQFIVDAIIKSRDKRVKYIIYEGRICSSYPANGFKAWEWRPYKGTKNPHKQHAHISVQPTQSLFDSRADWAIGIVPVKKFVDEPVILEIPAAMPIAIAPKVEAPILAEAGTLPAPLPPAPEKPFVPENKVVDAPPKEGSAEAATKVTVLGLTVPTVFVGVFTAIKSAITDGYISAAQIGEAVIGFVSANQRYVFAGLGLVISGMMLKKLYKQITLWLQMYFAARPDMNNVTVKPQ